MVTTSRPRKSRRPDQFPARDHAGDGLRLLDHFGRKMVRQMVLADDDLDVDAEIAGRAQNFDHAPHGLLSVLADIRAVRH